MKLNLFIFFLFSIQYLSAQVLDATISFNGSNNLVITINSDASFQFNQTHTGAMSLIIEEVYGADPANFTTSPNSGSISYTSSNGSSGTAVQMGAFGFDYNLYTIRDEEVTFPDPGPSFSSGDIVTIKAGTAIGLAVLSSPPPINSGPYNAYIISDDYLSVAASQITLPIKLLSFSGIQSNNQTHLKWNTALEINNKTFEIETSQDGRVFKKIGEVEGKGTTSEQQEYSFNVKTPRKGISYYRLKQIDFDGQFEYSKMISVDFKGENGNVGVFYPNPSKSGLVNLDYVSQNDAQIAVSVFDMTGQLVVNQIRQVSHGDNNLSFDFSELSTGVYIAKMGDERNPTHQKLIIEK